MKADWIEIKRDETLPQFAGIYVTLNQQGKIVIGRVTHEMLGAPAAFNVLYDRVNNRIGLKPAAASTRNAYVAGRSNRSGAKHIRVHRLMREHRIILPHTVQFDEAEIDDDGILILDLRTAIPSRRASARIEWHKRRRVETNNLTTEH